MLHLCFNSFYAVLALMPDTHHLLPANYCGLWLALGDAGCWHCKVRLPGPFSCSSGCLRLQICCSSEAASRKPWCQPVHLLTLKPLPLPCRWHGAAPLSEPDWSGEAAAALVPGANYVAFMVRGDPAQAVYVGFNPNPEPCSAALPSPGLSMQWKRVVDTARWGGTVGWIHLCFSYFWLYFLCRMLSWCVSCSMTWECAAKNL